MMMGTMTTTTTTVSTTATGRARGTVRGARAERGLDVFFTRVCPDVGGGVVGGRVTTRGCDRGRLDGGGDAGRR